MLPLLLVFRLVVSTAVHDAVACIVARALRPFHDVVASACIRTCFGAA